MPHAGGGGSSGGSHSSSSGVHSSAPRYDHHGNLHSPYYVRPGFYFNRMYIPYESKKRKSAVYGGSIFMVILSLVFLLLPIILFTSAGKYDGDRLEEYSLNKYAEVYNPKNSQSYEYNILVTIVAYETNDQFDYISIVGDNLVTAVDYAFGNKNTLFGEELLKDIPYENYYSNLYTYIAKAVDYVVDLMPSNCYSNNNETSKIVNETTFGPIDGEASLIAAEQKFYDKTGYHISFLIANNKEVYKLEILPIIIMYAVSVGLLGFAIFGFISGTKALKAVETSIKEGNPSKYFEGEDDFDTYFNEHPFPTNVIDEEKE
mgnify:CR=1 FL=1